MKRSLGDYQTPPELATAVVDRIAAFGPWERVLEPTCGEGNLLAAFLRKCNAEVHAFDIQPEYVGKCKEKFPAHDSNISVQDVFTVRFESLKWKRSGPLLILGNPPWKLIGKPQKRKFSSTTIDATTEIVLRLVAFSLNIKSPVTFAILLKKSSARAILRSVTENREPISSAFTCEINAMRYFYVHADACLLVMVVNGGSNYEFPFYRTLECTQPISHQKWENGIFINNIDAYNRVSEIDGNSHLEWLIGVKKHPGDFLLTGTDVYLYRIPTTTTSRVQTHIPSPFKIVISAMHKIPVFRLYTSQIPDDTCYYLPFATNADAEVCCALLNSDLCKEFLSTVTFSDAKRPITKAVLQRIDLGALARSLNLPGSEKLQNIVS